MDLLETREILANKEPLEELAELDPKDHLETKAREERREILAQKAPEASQGHQEAPDLEDTEAHLAPLEPQACQEIRVTLAPLE